MCIRDRWEGGHRVPGIISWPAVVKGSEARVNWDPVVTMDFLATVMDVLDVDRPAEQQNWHFDGVSVLPILKGETPPPRGVGWMFDSPTKSASNGYAFRYGKWKYVAGGKSCDAKKATFDCSKPQLYDMSVDFAENHDLASQQPEILAAIAANFSIWYDSIHDSIVNESKCSNGPAPAPGPFPVDPTPSTKCDFLVGKALIGTDISKGSVESREACCGACIVTAGCVASDYVEASRMRPTWEGITTGGTCHLKREFQPKAHATGEVQTACHVTQ
eukprot:TRINITY_DN13205_c0_g1_i3.p1 TRINITY_DN13205_c0_g1~~TRINITY_DN13205_c0_g1_i3.p1  ORF type:complete len:274 (-),score=53.03 TRINITY_DN13205_c0_g1_i3:101-922(-)